MNDFLVAFVPWLAGAFSGALPATDTTGNTDLGPQNLSHGTSSNPPPPPPS